MELNSISHAMTIAATKMMKVESGKDGIELLTKSNRVHADLTKSVSFGEEHYESKLIIREWISEVVDHPEMEFRCFVHQRKLNAVTQYFHDTYFKDLFKQNVQNVFYFD
jgi:hypothetical protein